jgi:hypothetical protein
MSLKAEGESLTFFGSNNKYRPIKAEKDGKRWIIEAPDATRFKYFFKLDGKIYLPKCELKEQDDFGGHLCIYEKVKR